ncbi:hypothetical protein NC652_039436 [Populus alba x Populus x berolinensis]|nr:hypothetical protein NC652_039436 [Populus alba x Populus x berolinensis]
MEVEESTCSNFQAIVSVAVDAEGEDVAATVHRFTQIPTQMLMDGCLPRHMNQSLGCFAAYFFGVYDGHGGPQKLMLRREEDLAIFFWLYRGDRYLKPRRFQIHRRGGLWHCTKKNPSLVARGEGVYPAAEAAAEGLSKLALQRQRGSQDNITAHRKLGRRTV